ncbi:class I SAM-dependent methyltransferase [Oleiharenicola sp. Vm1]|uniref:class I SAM-dependent methyltransferase n=1 Tax=Oleiharenicola sp. Vm1 TaxID=3398393 RepID=UPI0039F58830
MFSSNPVTARARATYHAAADCYDLPALSFWGRFGRATVARLGLKDGQRVLDVCCGSGASAVPAAEAVGAGGRVLAVDLALGLVELGKAKAASRGLAQLEFRVGDFTELPAEAGSFDAVVCVFGIFFLPDMPAAVRALWRWVRPGGQLALTTWGPRVFEPANAIFWEAVREVRPELHKDFNPWDRIATPAAVTAMMREGGVEEVRAEAEAGTHVLAAPQDWWSIVMGSGYRGTIEMLTEAERQLVEARVRAEVVRRKVEAIETNVVYARAVKR